MADGEIERATLRRREVETLTGLGSSSIYKLMAAGKFPAARRVPGSTVTMWLRAEIERWLASLPVADPADRPAPGRKAGVGR